MELKVLEERGNPLLKRTEYRFEIAHDAAATPTREEVRAELSKQLKVPKDRLIVERMRARFGTPRTRGDAMAYLNAEAAGQIVRSHILIRNGLKDKEDKTAGPAPAVTSPEAKPAPPEKVEPKTESKAPVEKPEARLEAGPKSAEEIPKSDAKPKTSAKSTPKPPKAATEAKKE